MKEYYDMTLEELESSWRICTNLIHRYLEKYYDTSNEEYRIDAIKYQSKQSEIQKEITKRSEVHV